MDQVFVMTKKPDERKTYHHGNLRQALLTCAVDVLDERGINDFSLREVARRAKVAAAAPAHHFGGVTGLLTAVATTGFEDLNIAFEKSLRSEGAAIHRLVSLCKAYVKQNQSYPGTFAIMFRHEILDNQNEQLLVARQTAFELLETAVRKAIQSDLTDERVRSIASILWATMHGLVALPLDKGEGLNKRIDVAARTIIAGANSIE